MALDFIFMYKISSKLATITNPILLASVGESISLHLTAANKSWKDFDLPMYDPSYIHTDNSYTNVCINNCFDHTRLNYNQFQIFSEIIEAIKETTITKKQILFYIDGPGGTGKTYLSNTILNYSRNDVVALAVRLLRVCDLLQDHYWLPS